MLRVLGSSTFVAFRSSVSVRPGLSYAQTFRRFKSDQIRGPVIGIDLGEYGIVSVFLFCFRYHKFVCCHNGGKAGKSH